MAKKTTRTELYELGEFKLIDTLTEPFETLHVSTVKGIGDDAAVVDTNGKHMVVTTDLLLEGVHFDLTYTPLKHLGYKAITVNLSDVYAMNARPSQVTVSIGISKRFCLEDLQELYSGIKLAC
jgi:thiamine-monophosphate kinase